MLRVRWVGDTLNDLAALWLQADAPLRQAIAAATHQIDQNLKTDPLSQSESRPGTRRIMFVAPLGITFRLEPDGQTISVLRVWLFRKRGK